MKTPKPDDCIAAISVRFFANGALQVSGNVGDRRQALAMLAAAADSVRAQPDGMGRPTGIITPPRDVVVPSPDPDFPIVPRGDMVRV
jgi:hypothetical protein